MSSVLYVYFVLSVFLWARENQSLLMTWQHVISLCLIVFAWCESDSCIFGWMNSACCSALTEFPIQFLNITSPTERAFSVAGPGDCRHIIFFSKKRVCMFLVLDESLSVWQFDFFAHCTFGLLRRFLVLFFVLFFVMCSTSHRCTN